jgi:hypothetical protein
MLRNQGLGFLIPDFNMFLLENKKKKILETFATLFLSPKHTIISPQTQTQTQIKLKYIFLDFNFFYMV